MRRDVSVEWRVRGARRCSGSTFHPPHPWLHSSAPLLQSALLPVTHSFAFHPRVFCRCRFCQDPPSAHCAQVKWVRRQRILKGVAAPPWSQRQMSIKVFRCATNTQRIPDIKTLLWSVSGNIRARFFCSNLRDDNLVMCSRVGSAQTGGTSLGRCPYQGVIHHSNSVSSLTS